MSNRKVKKDTKMTLCEKDGKIWQFNHTLLMVSVIKQCMAAKASIHRGIFPAGKRHKKMHRINVVILAPYADWVHSYNGGTVIAIKVTDDMLLGAG